MPARNLVVRSLQLWKRDYGLKNNHSQSRENTFVLCQGWRMQIGQFQPRYERNTLPDLAGGVRNFLECYKESTMRVIQKLSALSP